MDANFRGPLNFNRYDNSSLIMEVDGEESVKIIDHLGSGAQGTVYMGSYNSEMVAVKVQMPESQADSSIDKTLFDHPSIVKSIATGITTNTFVEKIINVMELATPLNPSAFIGNYKATLNLARHILEGLDYMHSQGYSHCDVKPDNIVLLKRNGEEFRFALCDLDMTINTLNPPKIYKLSSLSYMDPDTIRSHAYSFKSDVFSLGCALFQLATGQCIWGDLSGINEAGFLFGIYSRSTKYHLSHIEHKDFDDTLCKLIKSCIQPLSERPSARELLETLMEHMQNNDESMFSQE